jgi:HD-GYP domain-containing protein (c-di-GMP phosphodiesterase class II)
MIPKKTAKNSSIGKQIPAEELSTLLKVSSALVTSLDLSTVLQTAIDSTVEVMEVETGAIYVLQDDQLFLGATTPPLVPELEWLLLQPEVLDHHPHLKKALTDGELICIPDTENASLSPAEAAICEARQLKTILYIPLRIEEKAIGALIVGTTSRKHDFCDHMMDLCRTLSYQISLVIANAQLFKSVQQANFELTRAYDATLQGWSYALEMRDQETQGHSRRVTQITDLLARELGVTEPMLTHIRRGVLMHDIGKMSIPDAILKKPGPLTSDEMTIMRKHPDYAYNFLLPIDYLLPALDIPYCHHEKWDGSGYPRGLKGEEIPLAARIFAVVDVFDALTSDRPYRKAWRKEEALQYIYEQAGKHFDPAVAAVFLNEIAKKTAG